MRPAHSIALTSGIDVPSSHQYIQKERHDDKIMFLKTLIHSHRLPWLKLWLFVLGRSHIPAIHHQSGWEDQKSLDDGVEVKYKGIMFNTFTKVDDGSSGMQVYSGSGIFESRYEDWEELPVNSIFT